MPTISPLSGMAEPPVSVMFAVTSSWLIPLAVAIRSLCVHSPIRGGIMNSTSFIMDWRKNR